MMIVQPARFGVACAIDPYAANRTFFLRGQGANGATPSTDDLGNALTWVGGTQISTAQSAWASYGSSVRVASPNAPGYVSGPRGTGFALPGDFTMTARVRLDSVSYCTIMAHEAYNGSENGNWVFRLLPDGMEFRSFDAGGTNPEQVAVTGLSIPTAGAFVEVQAARVSGTLYMFWNGSLVVSGALANSLGRTANNAVRVGIGTTGALVTPAYYDDVTILKGVGAHTASYTPPSLPPC
ncbi:LamG-like jellyroll fold domain-containing protein [Azospirillum sp. 11R-A]|uniref:LamG-like jellyroll fold domain-containing protein n=1 Tax=Azospirillum sp. 11R-A TaxID=3111634 RepID=UPI003C1F47DD